MATTQQIAAAEIAEWFTQAPGKRMNPDGAYGLQCQDVANQYTSDIFGNRPHDVIRPVGGARETMTSVNPGWVEVIWNDSSREDLIPRTGDIIIWDGSPLNRFGHIAVVISATRSGVRVLQQDGFAAPTRYVVHPDGRTGGWYSDKPAHIADLGYDNPGTGPVRGWLRPRHDRVKNTGAITRGFGPKPAPPKTDPVAVVTPQGVMHGVDLASWQKGIDLAVLPADFAIVKVTGGTHYVNPLAAQHVREARASGKAIGLYHYAAEDGRKGTPAQEAAHFLRHALPLMDTDTNLVLDWENPAVIGAGGNVWARDWLGIVAKDTGRIPWFYGYTSAINAHQWATVAKTYPLWIAWYGNTNDMHGYATDFTMPAAVRPKAPFKIVAWQYSDRGRLRGFGGRIDLNVFYGNGNTWRSLARGNKPPTVDPSQKPIKVEPASNSNIAPKPRVHVVAPGEFLSLIAQKYGTTVAELQRLNRYIKDPTYLAVGDRITLPATTKPAVTQVRVEAGDSMSSIAAQFGVTLPALIAANPGINPDIIQPGQILNLPGGAAPIISQVIVEAGDNLTGIAAQFGTTVAHLVAKNGLRDPSTIYPGQILNL